MPLRRPAHHHPAYRTKQQQQIEHGADSNRLYGWRWRKCRNAFLQANPLCARCLSNGVIKVADQVHHKVKVVDDPSRLLDWTNLMSLCKACHAEIEPVGFVNR